MVHVRETVGLPSAPVELQEDMKRCADVIAVMQSLSNGVTGRQLDFWKAQREENKMIWDLFPSDRHKLERLNHHHVSVSLWIVSDYNITVLRLADA